MEAPFSGTFRIASITPSAVGASGKASPLRISFAIDMGAERRQLSPGEWGYADATQWADVSLFPTDEGYTHLDERVASGALKKGDMVVITGFPVARGYLGTNGESKGKALASLNIKKATVKPVSELVAERLNAPQVPF